MKKTLLLVTLTTTLLFALPSETKHNKEAFFDSQSGLLWQDNKDTQVVKKNWHNAKEYCERLNYVEHNDWRLPSKAELFSLYKKESNLKNLASSRYWSSSEYISEASRAIYVGFYDGRISHSGKSNRLYVRCVRDK